MKLKAKSNRVAIAPSSNRRRIVSIAICAVIAIPLGCGALWYRNHRRAMNFARGAGAAGGGVELITLDPQAFEGEARESYRIAREHPQLLAGLHCYCQCDERLGHRNLLDCYRDTHAASCGICMGEAKDAVEMTKWGASMEEIRDTLKGRYENQE